MIREAVALKEVPRNAYYLGMAGVLPYLATSCSTVYLAYCINHAPRYGAHLLLSPHYAHEYLALLEPIQIGFGASVSLPLSQSIAIWLTAANADYLFPRRHPLGP